MSKQVSSPAGWATVLLWVLTSALGGGIGFALGFAVSGTLSDFVGRTGRDIVLFGIFGSLVGIAQWLVLRTRIADAGWWMLASFLAWVVIGALASPLEQTLSLALAPAVAGAVVGVLQSLVLRRHVRWFGFWVVASTIGWALGWPVAGASDGVVALVVTDEIVGYVVLYAIIAAVAGVITGPAFILLLGRSQLERPEYVESAAEVMVGQGLPTLPPTTEPDVRLSPHPAPE
jgi:MFS family permease